MTDTHGEHFLQEDTDIAPDDTGATVTDEFGYVIRFRIESNNATRVGVNWAEVEYEVDAVPGTTAP